MCAVSHDNLITRLIKQLRTQEWRSFTFRGIHRNDAFRLADHLEWRLTTPQGDGFDIIPTGDDDHDRAALVAWLQAAANAGPYGAPAWGRSFSETMAWLVQHGHEASRLSITVASRAVLSPEIDDLANRQGLEVAYAAIVSTLEPQQ